MLDLDEIAMIQGELDAMTADRDRLAAELARVRRNHLRRMAQVARFIGMRLSHLDPEGSQRSRVVRFVTRCRAALAKEGGAT